MHFSKEKPSNFLLGNFLMARLRRLERLTHSLEGCCSIQLSYKRMSAIIILNKSLIVCKQLITKFHIEGFRYFFRKELT